MKDFSNSHVWLWELDHKAELWKIDAFELVLERTVESPLDSKEIKPINPKGSQPWLFIGRTDAEAEASIFWPPEAKGWVIGKDPDAEKDCRQEGKGATEDEMVGWHHWLNRHEFEQTPVNREGQGSLACCSPWGCRVGQRMRSNNNFFFVSLNPPSTLF